MEKLTEAELAVWRFFLKTHAKVIEHIEQDLSEQKRVPLSTYDVLIALFEAPGRKLRFQELTKKVVLSKSGLTRLVDRVEREGLIRREQSEEDRRGYYAVLTDEGERQLRKAWPIYAKGIKSYFVSPLSETELHTFSEAFRSIQENLEERQH